MHKALIKAGFWIATLALSLIFLVPAYFLLETVLPRGDRLFVVIVVLCLCLTVAGRITLTLFRVLRITDERLSIFGERRQRRCG